MHDDRPILDYARPARYSAEKPPAPVKDYGNVVFSHKTCVIIEPVVKLGVLLMLIAVAAVVVLLGVVAILSFMC